MGIAPTIAWAKLIGGGSYDYANSISTASDGSIYIAGTTDGIIDGQTRNGSLDAFISKFNSDGSKVWTKLLGGGSHDYANSISTASDGSIYIAGYTYGSIDGQSNSGSSDAFISKFNSDGSKVWTKLLGGVSGDEAKSVSTASDGSIYIAGYTDGSIDGQRNNGGYDAFITKFNSDGSKIWTKLLGGVYYDQGNSISTASDGSIYIAGQTGGSIDGQSNNGSSDAFITKFNSDGSKIWTKLLGGVSDDVAKSVSTASDGSITIAGYTDGIIDGQSNNGSADAFITKFNSDGSKVWTKLLGGVSYDVAKSVSTASDGSIYIAGSTSSSIDGQINNGYTDAFITKFNSDGSKVWTKLLGGVTEQLARSISTASDGSIYIAGYTYGSIDGQSNNGSSDAFITKFTSDGSSGNIKTFTLTPSATSINEGSTLTTSVATTNVASGTALYYSLSGTGINTPDFSSGALTGSGLVTSNGSFSFSHTLANDLTTEGTETLNIKLFSDSSRSTQVGSTASVSIADTSITPVIKNTGTAAFSISGKGDIGSQLSIIKTNDDPEGNGKFTYKWQSSVDGTNWTNLAPTSSSYTIAATDASKQLRASISYLDGKSNSESVDTSALSVSAVATTKLTAGDFATPVNINFSLPAYIMSTNWNIDKYYYYVEQYPMTLRTAFYADYLAGRYTNQALYGQNHYLTGGQAEGRAMVDTSGILPDANDYGAYVENYGITLLDIYRVDKRAVVNGGTMSLFAWGKEHYTNWGKAEGREISGGVEWGGIVRNNLDLYNQWQDAKIVNPTLSAFAFGYQRQNTIKSTLGVLVGSDTADKLTGQIAYGLNGNDVICSDGGRGILAGGFGDDLLVAANGGSDLAYGGPGSDIFQLNAGSTFNIRDFRKGADMIQLGSTLTSSGVTTQWDSADNSTYFYNGTSVIGKVYGKRPTEFTYSDSTNGVSKVYI